MALQDDTKEGEHICVMLLKGTLTRHDKVLRRNRT